MSILEKLSQAGVTTLVAMLIVFTVLIVLMFVIKIQTRILAGEKKQVDGTINNKISEKVDINKLEHIEVINPDEDLKLVAAIMAALSVYTGNDTSELKIKSIKRVNSGNWTNSAIKSNM